MQWTYTLEYDDQIRVLKYAYEDNSWYKQIEYHSDTTICSEYKVIADALTLITRETSYTETESNPESSKYCDYYEYFEDGKLTRKDVIETTTQSGFYSYLTYTLDKDGKASNVESITMTETDEGTLIVYMSFETSMDEMETFYCRLVSEKIDDYTIRDVYYDEFGIPSYTMTYYYHNPNATNIERIKETMIVNGAIYDIMGRKSNGKGLRIQNGKKIIVK